MKRVPNLIVLHTEYGGGWLLPPEADDQSILSSGSPSINSMLSLSSVRRSFSPGRASRISLWDVEDPELLVVGACDFDPLSPVLASLNLKLVIIKINYILALGLLTWWESDSETAVLKL